MVIQGHRIAWWPFSKLSSSSWQWLETPSCWQGMMTDGKDRWRTLINQGEQGMEGTFIVYVLDTLDIDRVWHSTIPTPCCSVSGGGKDSNTEVDWPLTCLRKLGRLHHHNDPADAQHRGMFWTAGGRSPVWTRGERLWKKMVRTLRGSTGRLPELTSTLRKNDPSSWFAWRLNKKPVVPVDTINRKTCLLEFLPMLDRTLVSRPSTFIEIGTSRSTAWDKGQLVCEMASEC